MINVSTITEHLLQWLKDDTDMQGVLFSRSEIVNEDPGKATNGWVGIYRQDVDYDPRNLGIPPNNYEGELTLNIVVQQTHLGSGAEAEDALEELVKKVLDRLVQVPKTYIDHFPDLTVQYTYLETDRKTMYFQGALITVSAEFSIEVT